MNETAARDELGAKLDTLVRSCIGCGLCLPHCATYLVTGSEVHSPRGRLLLLQEILSRGKPAPAAGTATVPGDEPIAPEILAAFDLCLGCRACETACPSGVSFELLEHAKQLAFARLRPRGPVPLGWFTSPWWLRTLRTGAGPLRIILQRLLGPRWRRRLENGPRPGRRLGRWLGSLPVSCAADEELVRFLDRLQQERADGSPAPAAAGPVAQPGRAEKPTVACFDGCANASLLPGTSRRLRELLRWAGCRLTETEDQTCCGAFDRHAGRAGPADHKREQNLRALIPTEPAWDFLVVEAAGCSLELKQYPEAIADKVRDATVLLAELDGPTWRPVRLRVALHEPCHARHGQGIASEPRRILKRIPGLGLCQPLEADVCCGSGGPYSLLHADLASAMGRRKAAILAETGADLVVTSNPGCLGQIADGLAVIGADLPVLPLSDLLWYASRPEAG